MQREIPWLLAFTYDTILGFICLCIMQYAHGNTWWMCNAVSLISPSWPDTKEA